jgi:hypothetical protein
VISWALTRVIIWALTTVISWALTRVISLALTTVISGVEFVCAEFVCADDDRDATQEAAGIAGTCPGRSAW